VALERFLRDDPVCAELVSDLENVEHGDQVFERIGNDCCSLGGPSTRQETASSDV
jgi:hypothetical protein